MTTRVNELSRLCECGDTRINHADGGKGFCLVWHDRKNRDGCQKFSPTEHVPPYEDRRLQNRLRREWLQKTSASAAAQKGATNGD